MDENEWKFRTNIRCESRIDISFGRLTMYFIPFYHIQNRDFYKLYFTYRNARGDIHYMVAKCKYTIITSSSKAFYQL